MDIQFKYEKSERYGDRRIEVFANKANVGILTTTAMPSGQLYWDPDVMTNVEFQFRNFDTFRAVVEELRKYKNENGFKYLTISAYSGGYVSRFDKGMLKRVGFVNLEDEDPAFMFLE